MVKLQHADRGFFYSKFENVDVITQLLMNELDKYDVGACVMPQWVRRFGSDSLEALRISTWITLGLEYHWSIGIISFGSQIN